MYFSLNLKTQIVDESKNYTSNCNLDFFSDKCIIVGDGIGIANIFRLTPDGQEGQEIFDYYYGVKGAPLTIETVMGATAVFWVRHPVKKLEISNFNWVIVEFLNGSSDRKSVV